MARAAQGDRIDGKLRTVANNMLRETERGQIMLKFIGGTIGFIFLIGLLVVVGLLALIF